MRKSEIQTGIRYRDKTGSETRVVLRVDNGNVMYDSTVVSERGRMTNKSRQNTTLEKFADWASMALPKISY